MPIRLFDYFEKLPIHAEVMQLDCIIIKTLNQSRVPLIAILSIFFFLSIPRITTPFSYLSSFPFLVLKSIERDIVR